jgi:hypothetical protein
MTYPKWVLENELARSCRPGYYSPSRYDVESEEVDRWIDHARDMGIKSIICLLSEEQLEYYQGLPGGLIDYYRSHGFTAVSIPIKDPAHDPAGLKELENSLGQIFDAYKQLPKPVVIHCSAGIDRTGRAVDYITQHLPA